MKKILVSVAALFCVAAAANAQTLVVVEEKPVLTNKRGTRILPEAGDFALGISVDPFFTYAKYLGRTTGPQSLSFSSLTPGIYGKFFVTDRQAIRIGFRLNFGNEYYYGTVLQNGSTETTVRDTKKDVSQLFSVNAGYEWRRGHGRLQGFYGLEAGITYRKLKTTYDYGNDMTTTYTAPNTWDFDLNQSRPMSSRMLENSSNANMQIGLYGFVGVEYFFAPKMSVGGEFNVGIVWNNESKSTIKTQYYDAAANTVNTNTEKVRDYDNPTDGLNIRTKTTGSIALMFYF